MKIIFLEPCYENFGGYFRSINMCNSLAKKGHQVTLICPAIKSVLINTKVNLQGVRIVELPHYRINQYINGRMARIMLSILYIVFNKADIVHGAVAIQPETFIPSIFAKIIGRKVVLDWDDLWQETSSLAGQNFALKYVKFCEDISPKILPNIVVVSRKLEQIAKKLGAKHTLILINAVNTNQFNLAKTKFEDKKYIAFFGNTLSKPRLEKTLEFCTKLKDLGVNIKLISNIDIAQLCKTYNIEFSNIDDYFLKTRKLNPEEMGDYLKQCKGALFIGENTLEEQCCYPIRIGSNIAANLPVFTVDNDSEYSNTIKDNKCGIVGKDTSDLANKVAQIIENKEKYTRIEKYTEKARTDLSWDNQINKLISFYKKIS